MALTRTDPGTPTRPQPSPGTGAPLGVARAVLAAGPLAALVALVVALATGATAAAPVPGWALWAALLALALGIPHGAVDSRLGVVAGAPSRAAAAYLALAALAACAVLVAPAPALLVVLVLSVAHFGTGDVESLAELSGDEDTAPAWRRCHAVAAGAAPVVLPLTSPAAAGTLALLDPRLGDLAGAAVPQVARAAALLVAAAAVVRLLLRRRRRAALELAILVALALCVTPLLAFAVYFAFWHALRHTARLALDGGGAVRRRSMILVVRQGLPALVVTAAVVVLLATRLGDVVSAGSLLWVGLAVVWGLTVPHMALVARFDRARRAARRGA